MPAGDLDFEARIQRLEDPKAGSQDFHCSRRLPPSAEQ
jgi:hypothetical protein